MGNVSRVLKNPNLLTLDFFLVLFPERCVFGPINKVQEKHACNKPSEKCFNFKDKPLVKRVFPNHVLIVEDQSILVYAIYDDGNVSNSAYHLPDKFADDLKHLTPHEDSANDHAYYAQTVGDQEKIVQRVV